MSEITVRINTENLIELIDERSVIQSLPPMTPINAAYLARALLACAAVLSQPQPPKPGTVVGDASFPTLTWKVGLSNVNSNMVLVLTIPPGIELVFEMPMQGTEALGGALIAQSRGIVPPERQTGTTH